jgi:hypothetical protein
MGLGLATLSGCMRPQAMDLPGAFSQVAAGNGHTCVLAEDGRAWCWGEGEAGQLGHGAFALSPVPVPVSASVPLAVLSARANRTCALARDGSAWCWGEDAAAPVGRGLKALTDTKRASPTVVSRGPFMAVAVGGSHTCVLAPSGDAYCWGANLYGELGDGSVRESHAAVPVLHDRPFTTIVAGQSHTCALDRDALAWCWGQNEFGQLGDGAQRHQPRPVAVAGGLRFKTLGAGSSHTCGLDEVGVAYCWGNGLHGQLGMDVGRACRGQPCALRPAVVPGEHRFRTLGVGPVRTCATTAAGELWCWGGDAVRPTPPARASRPAMAAVSPGWSRTCGVGEDRRIYCDEAESSVDVTLILVSGAVLGILVVGWERRLVPSGVFLPVTAAVLAYSGYQLWRIGAAWRGLARERSDWLVFLELIVGILTIGLAVALAGVVVLIVRAYRRRGSL